MAAENMPKNRFQRFIDKIFNRSSEVQITPGAVLHPTEAQSQPETSPVPPIEAPIKLKINDDEFWKARAERVDMLRELNKSSPYASFIPESLSLPSP